MTREEAINWLDRLYMGADITDEYGDMVDMQPYEEAFNMAIKALEQEPILDKIRAEIEKKHARAQQITSVLQMNAYTDCLQIIDKYKEEIEVEE